MKVGDKWGRLTCLEVIKDETPIMADDGRGGEYATGDVDVVNQYKIACECGRQVVIDTKEFKGKRKMLDCGCGRGLEDTMTVVMTATMTATLRRKIQEFANDQEMNVSKSIQRLVERGLEDWVPGQPFARKDTTATTTQDSEWR